MLVPRKPFSFRVPTPLKPLSGSSPWRRALAGLDQDFLTDNQLSVWLRRDGAGVKAFHFYPLPFPHVFSGPKWDFAEITNRDSLRGSGPSLRLEASGTTLRFRPHLMEKRVRIKGGGLIQERCSILGSTLLLDWQTQGVPRIPLELSLPFFPATLWAGGRAGGGEGQSTFVASIRDAVYVALVIKGLRDIAVGEPAAHEEGKGFTVELAGKPARSGRVTLTMSVAYDRREALRAAGEAAEAPEALFRKAEDAWEGYFRDVVPRFVCSNKKVQQLYYYQAYVTRCNVYDIPFEPFTHPYTCPWKTGAVWQWSWNTPMDSVAERWLNDKRLGAGGILLEAANGGAPNIGSYLHPLVRQTRLRDHHDHITALSENQKELRPEDSIEALATLPHTTPNGLLGAWELYLCSRDRAELRAFLDLMVEAEALFSARELPSGLYTTYFVDEFDYSLRWRPYTREFKKADPQNMFRMQTPVVAVDYNCYLYALRERILDAVAALGGDAPSALDVEAMAAANARLRLAINERLWDEADGFYYDAHPQTLEHSGVRCIGAYSALYAGIASRRQAERMVAHLQNPAEFGTPYPCPSISMDTPDVDPSIITYGGDSMITSGIWFTIVGLARYGFRELAARYVARTVEMLTMGGPSSSYSYHSVTGAPNMPRHQLTAQSCIATDLICRYVVGIEPGSSGFRVDPIALGVLGIRSLSFGPYRYGESILTVRYDDRRGHRVETLEKPCRKAQS